MNKATSALLLGALVLSGCTEEETQAADVQNVRPVMLISPKQSSSIIEYSLPAIVEASTTRELSFPVSGQIVELNVKEGDEVAQGQVISQLNVRQFDNRLRSAKADLEAIKLQHSRVEKLLKSNAIARQQFDQITADLEKAKAAYDSAKKDREDAVLVSPFDGIISITHKKKLQAVSGGEPIVTLDTFGDAEAVVNIPANVVAFEKQYELVETKTILDVMPETPIASTLVEISTQADVRSQTYQARFSFSPPEDLTILPGMTAMVKAKVDYKDNSVKGVLLPVSAVMSDDGGHYVWVFNQENQTVSKRYVLVEQGVSEKLLVIEGLSLDDRVVGAGGAFLFDDMKVIEL